MALFTKESLETLRQRIDLVEVLSSHVDFKRSGTAYKALCPFHEEKTPSFMIQKGDHHYHCFGCGAHGDAIQFLMSYMKMNFSDAVESLAQQFNVHLDTAEGSEDYQGPSKRLMKEALDYANRFFHFYLLHTEEGHEALHYLYNRGIDLDFIKAFQIGLAPKPAGIFRKMMHEKKNSDEVMAGCGLISPSNRGGYRDFFYDRITFPIHNPAGSVIGFSARKFHEETFGGKYVNTPETPLFKKSRVLFGLNYSRRRIAKERRAIIVEGQIDALRLIHAGIDIAVAGQGTAFGEGHSRELLQLGVNQIYLAMDSDDAGKEAASKIGDLFQKEGVNVSLIQMPPGSDPDSYIQERGVESFLKLMEESIDYLDFLVDYQSRFLNTNTPAGKNELVQLISKQVRQWSQPLMVHESLRKLAHLTQVPEEVIGIDQHFSPNIHIRKSASIGLQTIDPVRILESDFLRLLFNVAGKEEKYLHMAQNNLTPEDLQNSSCSRIYAKYLENPASDLLSLINEPEDQTIISELMEKHIREEKAEEHFIQTVQKILDRNWMDKREQLSRKINSGKLEDDEAIQLMKEFKELTRQTVKQ